MAAGPTFTRRVVTKNEHVGPSTTASSADTVDEVISTDRDCHTVLDEIRPASQRFLFVNGKTAAAISYCEYVFLPDNRQQF